MEDLDYKYRILKIDYEDEKALRIIAEREVVRLKGRKITPQMEKKRATKEVYGYTEAHYMKDYILGQKEIIAELERKIKALEKPITEAQSLHVRTMAHNNRMAADNHYLKVRNVELEKRIEDIELHHSAKASVKAAIRSTNPISMAIRKPFHRISDHV